MANPVPRQNWITFLFDRLGREGIFAVLFIGLLVALGYVLWGIGDFARVQGAAYLDKQHATMDYLAQANADNAKATASVGAAVAELVTFNRDVAMVHARQQDTLDQLSELASNAEVRDEDITQKLEMLVALMDKANQMMSGSLQDREQTQQVLERIEQEIIDLTAMMQKWCSADPNGVATENSNGR